MSPSVFGARLGHLRLIITGAINHPARDTQPTIPARRRSYSLTIDHVPLPRQQEVVTYR